MISKRAKVGDTAFFETVRRIALYVTDNLWVEHLETMDYTRSSLNLRAYGQRDPLIEYKKEGLKLFKEMEANFKEKVFSLIETMNEDAGEERDDTEEKPALILNTPDGEGTDRREKEKVGRNDPCPCGSGKKYKNCGLLETEEHKKNMLKK